MQRCRTVCSQAAQAFVWRVSIIASEISAFRVNEHVLRRQRNGASNATVNRELNVLRRMFTLAQRYGLVQSVPYVPRLKESIPRQGFVERESFTKLLAALPDHLRPVVEFLYYSGWRKNEALRLTWEFVDLPGRTVRLNPAHSKNGEGRVLPLRGRLLELIEQQQTANGCGFVFQHRGRPLKDFRRAWQIATESAGLKGLLIHDLRRSAVRNLVRSSVPESVAMKLTGHKTRSVFERYNIVSDSDLARAVERICG